MTVGDYNGYGYIAIVCRKFQPIKFSLYTIVSFVAKACRQLHEMGRGYSR